MWLLRDLETTSRWRLRHGPVDLTLRGKELSPLSGRLLSRPVAIALQIVFPLFALWPNFRPIPVVYSDIRGIFVAVTIAFCLIGLKAKPADPVQSCLAITSFFSGSTVATARGFEWAFVLSPLVLLILYNEGSIRGKWIKWPRELRRVDDLHLTGFVLDEQDVFDVEFHKVAFAHTTFKDSRLHLLTGSALYFDRCTFQGSKVGSWLTDELLVANSAFRACELEGTRLSYNQLSNCTTDELSVDIFTDVPNTE